MKDGGLSSNGELDAQLHAPSPEAPPAAPPQSYAEPQPLTNDDKMKQVVHRTDVTLDAENPGSPFTLDTHEHNDCPALDSLANKQNAALQDPVESIPQACNQVDALHAPDVNDGDSSTVGRGIGGGSDTEHAQVSPVTASTATGDTAPVHAGQEQQPDNRVGTVVGSSEAEGDSTGVQKDTEVGPADRGSNSKETNAPADAGNTTVAKARQEVENKGAASGGVANVDTAKRGKTGRGNTGPHAEEARPALRGGNSATKRGATPFDMDAIHAKAMRDVRAVRKLRGHAVPPLLRGFAGKTFVTSTGRTLTAAQFLDSIERFSNVPGLEMLERDADGNVVPVTSAEHVGQKYASKQVLEAMRERLSVVPDRPPRPPPLPPVWVLRSLVEGKWVEVHTPWKKISPAKQTAAMRGIYDRHKEEEDAKRTALSAKYLQPLCKSKGAVASPQEEMQRFRYQLLKFELSPQFHRIANGTAKSGE